MKKIFFLVILVTGITQAKHAHAQNNINMIFDVPAEKFNREFTVELERKNRMEVSVTSMQVMDYISNIDSILKVFFNELTLIPDSLPLSTAALRLDYNMDDATIKKLRIRKTIPPTDDYVFIKGVVSLLKMQQDTLIIHGKVPAAWLRSTKKFKEADYGKYYFSITFYLNDLEDILAYKNQELNEKIKIIQAHYKDKWLYRQDERRQLKTYPEITSNSAKGYILTTRTFLLKKSVEVQNYKNYFVPSISCTPVFIQQDDFIKREIGISIEADFGFENLPAGTTKTRINIFTGVTYNVVPLTASAYWIKFHPNISFAGLVSRSGNMYEKNTARIGLGSFSAGNLTTSIQPAIYYNNFFRHITPSLRIVQRF